MPNYDGILPVHEKWLIDNNMGSTSSHQSHNKKGGVMMAGFNLRGCCLNYSAGRGRGNNNNQGGQSFNQWNNNQGGQSFNQPNFNSNPGRAGPNQNRGGHQSHRRRSGGRNDARRENQFGATCQICKRVNHTAEFCWDRYKGYEEFMQWFHSTFCHECIGWANRRGISTGGACSKSRRRIKHFI